MTARRPPPPPAGRRWVAPESPPPRPMMTLEDVTALEGSSPLEMTLRQARAVDRSRAIERAEIATALAEAGASW